MTLVTVALLFLLFGQDVNINAISSDKASQKEMNLNPMVQIDSLDFVIFNLDQISILGDIVEIPVFIYSDDLINSLDFSMSVNVENLEYLSIVEYASELNYAAHLNLNDLKFRFTSNSFSPYPLQPSKVVAVRFKVLSNVLRKTDFSDFRYYLNGERCSGEVQLQGDEIAVSNSEIVTTERFISPNPATNELYISSDIDGALDMFDANGQAVIHGYKLNAQGLNTLNVQSLARGTYTVRIISKDHTIRTQKIVLQ